MSRNEPAFGVSPFSAKRVISDLPLAPVWASASALRIDPSSVSGDKSEQSTSNLFPTHDIELNGLNPHDLAICNFNDDGALRTGFTNVTTLDVAGKDNIRIAADNFIGVHMAKCPIVISTPAQVIKGTRCVSEMAQAATEGGMEHTYVEDMWERLRIRHGEVVNDCRVGETLAMYGDAKTLK